MKLVPKDPRAARELLFESVSGSNIIPILDSGEWQDFYVLVMPRAEKSLRQYLSEAGRNLTIDDAISILADVSEALASLKNEIVHRDLKPENVLLYQGHWCLADFGIARYAEATTAPDTHKYSMTSPYAAPEQWRGERATPATDVYAFGVMAFELLTGQRPFPGPDFRAQHLNQAPPALTGYSPSLASLVAESLYKAPRARPTPANILLRLRASQQTPSPAAAKLRAANQQIVGRNAQGEAKESAQKSLEEQRMELMDAAQQSFTRVCETLIARILEDAPSATVTRGTSVTVRLGDGILTIEPVRSAPSISLGRYGEPPFDVIAYTTIAVRKPRDHYGYEGRSHSLWFCDAHDAGVYRWFETAFMAVYSHEVFSVDPFALSPTDDGAAGAFATVVASRQVAWQPVPFDQGEEDQFLDRWLGWFAGVADGSLNHPSAMPENSGGKYRRSGSPHAE